MKMFCSLSTFLATVGILAVAIPSHSQEPGSIKHTSLRNSIDVRSGIMPPTFTLAVEYRHHWSRYISTDVALWVPFGVHLGASFWPADWAGIQATAGLTSYGTDDLDAPSFEAKYSYALTATLRIPISGNDRRKLFFAASAGPVWLVDPDYNVHGGFILHSYQRSPKYQVETRTVVRVEVGLGFAF